MVCLKSVCMQLTKTCKIQKNEVTSVRRVWRDVNPIKARIIKNRQSVDSLITLKWLLVAV